MYEHPRPGRQNTIVFPFIRALIAGISHSSPSFFFAGRGAALTVNQNMTASNTHSNDDLLKATFKLIELGIDTYLIISSKHSNYAIDFETIAGVKTLLLRDYRSYFVDKSSAGFITFKITRSDMATYIQASERYSYDETAGGYIADSSWEPMNVAIEGSAAILISERLWCMNH